MPNISNPSSRRFTVREALGLWPRTKAFDRCFLNVGDNGDLLLAASSTKGKGSHLVVAFAPEDGKLNVRWSRLAQGALDAMPSLTREGLTLPFADPAKAPERLVPHSALPTQTLPGLAGCF